jgi:DNA-binding MarR family transcriptional regulator
VNSERPEDSLDAARQEVPVTDLHKALSHELRVEILTHLTEQGPGGASEIGKALGVATGDVTYHLKKLVNYGLAELVEVRPARRGSPVKVYRARGRPLIRTEEVERWPPLVRSSFAGQVFKKALDDVLAGFAINAFGKRSDWHLTRTPLELDEKGWQEMLPIHEHALNETFKAQKRSEERSRTSEETPIRVSSSQLCFVIPPR